jgi:hypothetical protein
MIQLAEQNNPTATFKVLDALKIHELNDLFDAIIVGFCLPYFAPMDAEHFIKNAYSALNKKVFYIFPLLEGNPQLWLPNSSSGDRTYFYYYHLNDLEKLLSSNQFKLLKTFHVEYEKSNNEKEIHTVLIAEKHKKVLLIIPLAFIEPMNNTIHFTVIEKDSKRVVNTYFGEYRNLMTLLKDQFYPDDFGECGGTGKCGTCVIRIKGLTGSS